MSDNLTVVVISGSKNEVFSKLNNIVGTNLETTSIKKTSRYLTSVQERIVRNYLNKNSKVFFDDIMIAIRNRKRPLPSTNNLSLYLKSNGYNRISTPIANYWTKG